MIDCFTTQLWLLEQFDLATERFRLAPEYDFREPPHPGELHYETLGWDIDRRDWRRNARRRARPARPRRIVSLTVLSVGYALAPVGPDAVGGAEQVLSALDRALVAAGHSSLVVAPEGSQVAGHLIATAKLPAHITDRERRRDRTAAAPGDRTGARRAPDRSDPCPRARFRRAPAAKRKSRR